jgi:peptidoglycan/xylan/chitin deacetylase (PgdA/CDA1 family)
MDRRRILQAGAAAAAALYATGCDSGGGSANHAASPPGSTGPTEGASPSAASPGATPAASPPALPAEVVNGPRDKPNVALTFHGQGDPALVRQLLSALGSGGARVTVLAVGSWLTAQPEMAKLILDGGHELGNHTQNHLGIATMSSTQAFTEINACAAQLKKLTGSIGSWFRPSQTQHSTAMIRAQALKVGYRTCLSYDLDSLDYTDPGSNAVVSNTLKGVQKGSIVSMHFGHAGTVSAIPRILDGLRQRGLHPVTMTELVS